MKTKKTLALVLCVMLLLALFAGCADNGENNSMAAGAAESRQESAGGTSDVSAADTNAAGGSDGSVIRVGIAADPGGMGPFAARSMGMISTYRTVYEYLVDRDSFGGDMVGCLMESYEKIDDTTYNLKLYEYIHDADGNAFKAGDVVFSIESAKASGNLPKLNQIESVKEVDAYTVEFVFAGALSVGELEALWSESPMVTQAAYEASSDSMSTTPVGTSAYKVIQYTEGSVIILEDTGDYWQTDESKMPRASRHNVDRIEFYIVTESAQRAIAMETGSVDIVAGVASSDVTRFSDESKYSTFDYLENTVSMLYFNCDEGKVFGDNLALREAVAYAIDTAATLDGAYNGDGLSLNTLGSPKYGDYNTAWDSEDYFGWDQDKAAQLLEDAGYPGGTGLPELTIMCEIQEDFENICTVIQGYLLQIGVNVKIASYDSAMFNSLETDSDSWDLLLKSGASTDYLVNIWKLYWSESNYDGHTLNFVYDDTLQGLLKTALTPETHTQENVDAIHGHIKDNCYALGLNTYNSYVVGTPSVSSVFLDSRNCVIPGACEYNF